MEPAEFYMTPEQHEALFGYRSEEPIYTETIKAAWVTCYLMGKMTAEEVRTASGKNVEEIQRFAKILLSDRGDT